MIFLNIIQNNRGNIIYEFVLWSPAIALGLFILYLLIFLIRFQNGWNERINLEEYSVDSVEITDLNSEPLWRMPKQVSSSCRKLAIFNAEG